MSGSSAGMNAGGASSQADGHPAWRRLACGGGGAMFVGMGLGRFSYSAMVPALIESGGLTPVEAGRIGMANLAGFAIGALISVWLLGFFRRATLLRGALLVAMVGLLLSAGAWGVWWLAVCRATLGLATGLIMVHSLALIAETAPAAARPMAASFVFGGVGLGILSSGVLVPNLLAHGLAFTWSGLAIAGLAGTAIALWGWHLAPEPVRSLGDRAGGRLQFGIEPMGLLAAHALFSFGIVPHTLYWVDFLVRDQGLGMETGGLHWSIVGVFAILGPLLTAGLARIAGTAMALVIACAVLGLGLAAPFLWPSTLVLLASSVLFGAQPGLSSLMAARARDLGRSDTMARFMRAMIIANSCGAFLGGLFFPWAYGPMHGPAPLFVIAGAAMSLAAVAAWPRRT